MVNPAYQCLSSLPIKAIFIISTIVGSIEKLENLTTSFKSTSLLYNIGMSVSKLCQYIVLITAAHGVFRVIICINCTACIYLKPYIIQFCCVWECICYENIFYFLFFCDLYSDINQKSDRLLSIYIH